MPTIEKNQLSLADQIKAQIRTQGPMSLATYMGLCLTHPELGYYKKLDPFGSKGDFITAPEISQMFGEILGIWVVGQWHILGRPAHFDLVELGPGRGTLMADALRVITKDEGAKKALNVVLLETNPVLIEAQKQALSGISPVWISEIEQLAKRPGPKIILANEFFDALPIRQFQYDKGSWHERMVGLKDNRLVFGLSPTPMPRDVIPPQIKFPEQDAIWETCPLATKTVFELAKVLNRHGGAMMAIDYGYEKTTTGETFQALSNHEFTDPFADPGNADLSAHVDFEALINAARSAGTRAHYSGTQGQMLNEFAIAERAKNLCAANPQNAQDIMSDLARLTHKDKMGDLFKVMVMFGTPPPPLEQDKALLASPKISHGFFGRQGGCSPAPLASLNVSGAMGDHPDFIKNNRAIACAAINVAPERLAILSQVHSPDVIVIDETFDMTSSPKADAMVSKTPGIGLGILTADCTPVLFADPEKGIIGACHAGWQGAVSGIIANTICAMEKLGAEKPGIIAALGPTIWQHNYEVGPDWTSRFLARHPDAQRFIAKMGKNQSEHFDLPGFVLHELKKQQLAHIAQVGGCTCEHPEQYFSHRFATRKEEKTGRQISIIALNANKLTIS
ncbi:MAG TPA: peptidoglycan editing factor PgeF [Devosia sp.]|nr:peptidoglycan editing factor PgeF [Devosia sp.]